MVVNPMTIIIVIIIIIIVSCGVVQAPRIGCL